MLSHDEPVVIQYLSEDPWVAVKEVFIEDGIIVGESLGQPRQSRGGNLLQRGLVGLEPDAAHVERDAVLSVHQRHSCLQESGNLLMFIPENFDKVDFSSMACLRSYFLWSKVGKSPY